MWILINMFFLHARRCSGIEFIDLPIHGENFQTGIRRYMVRSNHDQPEPLDITEEVQDGLDENPRRKLFHDHQPKQTTNDGGKISHWLFRNTDFASPVNDEKDADIKKKINTLVQQTLHDTERKVKSVSHFKDNNRDKLPYRIGFILNMIKKSRDIMNELFNVAVKHRDQWMALEQLKIFELVVHTNVDTTNLVRQLVEIHIQYLNSTSNGAPMFRKRVVVL